jgi:hypothetical protein
MQHLRELLKQVPGRTPILSGWLARSLDVVDSEKSNRNQVFT